MHYPDSAVLVTGLARVGKEDVISSVYGNFALSLIVDRNSDTILEFGCSMVLSETADFIRFLIVGRKMTEMEEICESVRTRFFGLAQKAVIVALKDAQNRYQAAAKLKS